MDFFKAAKSKGYFNEKWDEEEDIFRKRRKKVLKDSKNGIKS